MALEAVGEEQEEDAGAQGEGGGEGAEGAGEDLGDGVHAAGAEAGEDPGGDVDEADEGAGRADEGGDLLGAGAAENPPHPNRNQSGFVPIYRDRHGFPYFPWSCAGSLTPVGPCGAFGGPFRLVRLL
ncbi:hypothetical protein GCM10010299_42730 [Streptomyces tanashiensis]|nr:hypothetical protein GCM10010299_42730 [Streptomyces tanashiensis]